MKYVVDDANHEASTLGFLGKDYHYHENKYPSGEAPFLMPFSF